MEYLEGLNDNQKVAATHMEGACCVVAAAGSGKSMSLTVRVKHLIENGIPPQDILMITFTKKAANEMSERMEKLIGEDINDVTIGTLHSIFYGVLRDYSTINCLPLPTLAPDWWRLKTIKEILEKSNSTLQMSEKDILAFISHQKNNAVGVNDSLKIDYEFCFMINELKYVYQEYENAKEKENKIDFDDMLFQSYKLLKEDSDLLESYQEKFKYILVDEFQDINVLQDKVITLVAQKYKNLFVVGDARQSIYGFLSANVGLIHEFQSKWDSELIDLDLNYRSTPNIVECGNRLIKHNSQKIGGEAKAFRPEGEEPKFMYSFDDNEEADKVVEEIEKLIVEGHKPEDFAILYRINSQSRALEESLVKSKLPFVIIGGTNFYKRKEVADILAYVRLAYDLNDDVALDRVVNVPTRYLGKVFKQELTKYSRLNSCSMYEALVKSDVTTKRRYWKSKELVNTLKDIHEFAKESKSVGELIEYIVDSIEYRKYLTDDNSLENEVERLENIDALISNSDSFDKVDEFLEYISNIQSDNESQDGKIKLMTLHRSKGLEFPVVFLVGVSQGLLPFERKGVLNDIEEERRLAYVGVTRAEDILYVSEIDCYGRRVLQESPFIEEMKK